MGDVCQRGVVADGEAGERRRARRLEGAHLAHCSLVEAAATHVSHEKQRAIGTCDEPLIDRPWRAAWRVDGAALDYCMVHGQLRAAVKVTHFRIMLPELESARSE